MPESTLHSHWAGELGGSNDAFLLPAVRCSGGIENPALSRIEPVLDGRLDAVAGRTSRSRGGIAAVSSAVEPLLAGYPDVQVVRPGAFVKLVLWKL